ncbi:MAG: MAPEG family protein [Pseudomonadota bacterium]
MPYALFSVGMLGLLVFFLGQNVSLVRRSVAVTQREEEADPKSALRKAIRAHGNCIEYSPMLALMILALGLRMPLTPWWIAALMLLAVAARYIHALGILTAESIYATNSLRFIGASLTYVTGLALSAILIWRATLLF